MQLTKNASVDEEEYTDEHVRELMVGANQYGIDVEWASELPNRNERSRLWRHDLIDTRDTYCF